MNAKNGEMVTLKVEGDLVGTKIEGVRAEVDQLFKAEKSGLPEWKIFNLDLTHATMLDSVGLNLVVMLVKRVQKHGGKLKVSYSNDNVFRTFLFTRLDKHIELVKR